MRDVRTVGILGAGTMGAGIAQVAAEAGLDVVLVDPVAGATQRAVERIAGFVRRKVEKGQLSAPDAEAAIRRVAPGTALGAMAAADLVIEAIPEDLELKRQAFRLLDAAAPPQTLLATAR